MASGIFGREHHRDEQQHSHLLGVLVIFNVKTNYGAKGDGVHDDTASIIAAVRAAYAAGSENNSPAQVYFPAGRYLIRGDNPLGKILVPNPNATSNAVGLQFVGEGKYSSVLRLDTTGASAPRWMYSQPTGFTIAQGVVFQDLGFEGSAPDTDGGWAPGSIKPYANGFKFYGHSGSPEVQNKDISFVRCAAHGFQTLFDFEGNAVASEISHHNCSYGFIADAAYLINNGQSVNHRFFGTDIEEVYGDVFRIGDGGGVQVFGGSIIMMPDGGATDKWLVNVPSAISGDPVEFFGVRLEGRGNYSNLVNLANLSNRRVLFHGGRLLDQGTATKDHWLRLGDYSRVDLVGTTLDQQSGAATKVHLIGTGLGGEVGTVLFDKCRLPSDFSDQCEIDYVGCISAVHTQGNIGQNGKAYTANDFTLNGAAALGQIGAWSSAAKEGDGGTACLQPMPKLAYLKCWPDYWPTSVGEERTLKLPRNALIKTIHLLYPGGGLSGFASPTFLRVSNDDYSAIHTTVAVGDGSLAAEIHLENYFYAVNAAAKDRTLRLSFGPSTGAPDYAGVTGSNGGGIALVEYL
jgi:hypothetical protein